MCRWAAYLGPETYLEDIISSPCHSLVAQSHDAHEAKTRTNGDGFGVARYGNRDEPAFIGIFCPHGPTRIFAALRGKFSRAFSLRMCGPRPAG